MGRHEELLQEGPRMAPEPETAEERTRRLSGRAVGGGLLGGGAVAAKVGAAGALGGLGKVFVWLIAWHGLLDAGRLFGWLGILVAVGAIAAYLVVRGRRRSS